MRSLGTLGGPFGFAISVNTHRRVVGRSQTADGRMMPFLWAPGSGMVGLPTLGGDFGVGVSLNEFGNIIGRSSRANGAVRATLWIPASGPLAVAPMDERAEANLAGASAGPHDPTLLLCGLMRRSNGQPRSSICRNR
jgi:probable HAF family extracellular repeat protein